MGFSYRHIDIQTVSDEKQDSLSEVTNRWNKCKINNTILEPDVYFIEIYSLNLKFKRMKAKYENIRTKLMHIYLMYYLKNIIQ